MKIRAKFRETGNCHEFEYEAESFHCAIMAAIKMTNDLDIGARWTLERLDGPQWAFGDGKGVVASYYDRLAY